MNQFRALPRLLRIAVLSTAFVLPGWCAEAGDKFTAFGPGGSSCGTWAANKAKASQNPAPYFIEESWVLGFVAAFNNYSWKGANVASETNAKRMMAWVDKYCAANPTKSIAIASLSLIDFLSSGPHPNDK